MISYLHHSSLLSISYYYLLLLNPLLPDDIITISGSIKIDGVDIQSIGLNQLRSNLCIIPQDPLLFGGKKKQTDISIIYYLVLHPPPLLTRSLSLLTRNHSREFRSI